MSLGASSADISIIVTFCKALYRKCRTAGREEYDEISREVRELQIVLEDLESETKAPESPLRRNSSTWDRQLAPVVGDCDSTLRQLDVLLKKYGRSTTQIGGGTSPNTSGVSWNRMKLGSDEMDQLGDIRVKLISHKRKLTSCLDTIQSPAERMGTSPAHHEAQLNDMLDKVDDIIERFQSNEGNFTNYDDDRETWKEFRRELMAEGVSSSVLEKHKVSWSRCNPRKLSLTLLGRFKSIYTRISRARTTRQISQKLSLGSTD